MGGGVTRAPEARAARGYWGHAPPEKLEIQRLGNAISSVLQELFAIYAYRELFTSYCLSKPLHIESITLATSITK